MASLTQNKSIEELIERFRVEGPSSGSTLLWGKPYRTVKVLITILKKLQETSEQNKKTIKEQKELIEHLWAWAEEKDDGEKPDGEKPDATTQRLQGDSSKYIDYSNFKLCDEYCGERQGFTYLHGTHGSGYYALKMPIV